MAFPIGLLDISPVTLMILGAIAVLLFGEQLPEVARSFGKKFSAFRRSVQNIQDEIRSAAQSATSELTSALNTSADSSSPSTSTESSGSNGSERKRRSRESDEDYEEATAPKFVPPPSEAVARPSETGVTRD